MAGSLSTAVSLAVPSALPYEDSIDIFVPRSSLPELVRFFPKAMENMGLQFGNARFRRLEWQHDRIELLDLVHSMDPAGQEHVTNLLRALGQLTPTEPSQPSRPKHKTPAFVKPKWLKPVDFIHPSSVIENLTYQMDIDREDYQLFVREEELKKFLEYRYPEHFLSETSSKYEELQTLLGKSEEHAADVQHTYYLLLSIKALSARVGHFSLTTPYNENSSIEVIRATDLDLHVLHETGIFALFKIGLHSTNDGNKNDLDLVMQDVITNINEAGPAIPFLQQKLRVLPSAELEIQTCNNNGSCQTLAFEMADFFSALLLNYNQLLYEKLLEMAQTIVEGQKLRFWINEKTKNIQERIEGTLVEISNLPDALSEPNESLPPFSTAHRISYLGVQPDITLPGFYLSIESQLWDPLRTDNLSHSANSAEPSTQREASPFPTVQACGHQCPYDMAFVLRKEIVNRYLHLMFDRNRFDEIKAGDDIHLEFLDSVKILGDGGHGALLRAKAAIRIKEVKGFKGFIWNRLIDKNHRLSFEITAEVRQHPTGRGLEILLKSLTPGSLKFGRGDLTALGRMAASKIQSVIQDNTTKKWETQPLSLNEEGPIPFPPGLLGIADYTIRNIHVDKKGNLIVYVRLDAERKEPYSRP